MADLQALLHDAKQGALDACQRCSWNPAASGSVAFATSCREHGVDYVSSASISAVSVQVAQDPGGSGAEKTGRLCFVCNSDRTARNTRSLWEAAVAFQPPDADKYLSDHYWANAVMHGKSTGSESRMEDARSCCSSVLLDQIHTLKPKVIVGLGEQAVKSLFQVGLLKNQWDRVREGFSTGAYVERSSSLGFETSVYCTYHTTTRVINKYASRLHTSLTEELLNQRVEQLEDQMSIAKFLESNLVDTSNGRGMRVLLLHWLDIGEAIRDAHSIRA